QPRVRIGVKPGEDLAVGAGDAGRSVPQAVAFRVLADRVEQFADRGLGTFLVEHPYAWRRTAGIRQRHGIHPPFVSRAPAGWTGSRPRPDGPVICRRRGSVDRDSRAWAAESGAA